MNKRLNILRVAAVAFIFAAADKSSAQLSGTFHAAPGSVVTYEYHIGQYESVVLPLDVTVTFSESDPTSSLTAVIHQALIGDTPYFDYGIVDLFPMTVTGMSTDGTLFRGDLLGTQYLFEWEIEQLNDGSLSFNGVVGWAGGRYEETNIVGARLLPGIAGDYNHDGSVNAGDYVLWRDTLGQTGPGLSADGSGDEIVNVEDLSVWSDRFGQSIPPTGGASSIPEPTTVTLALLVLAAIRAFRSFTSVARKLA